MTVRAPTTQTDHLLSNLRAGLKHMPPPTEKPINRGAAARPAVGLPADKMAAFLQEMKSVRLRKVPSGKELNQSANGGGLVSTGSTGGCGYTQSVGPGVPSASGQQGIDRGATRPSEIAASLVKSLRRTGSNLSVNREGLTRSRNGSNASLTVASSREHNAPARTSRDGGSASAAQSTSSGQAASSSGQTASSRDQTVSLRDTTSASRDPTSASGDHTSSGEERGSRGGPRRRTIAVAPEVAQAGNKRRREANDGGSVWDNIRAAAKRRTLALASGESSFASTISWRSRESIDLGRCNSLDTGRHNSLDTSSAAAPSRTASATSSSGTSNTSMASANVSTGSANASMRSANESTRSANASMRSANAPVRSANASTAHESGPMRTSFSASSSRLHNAAPTSHFTEAPSSSRSNIATSNSRFDDASSGSRYSNAASTSQPLRQSTYLDAPIPPQSSSVNPTPSLCSDNSGEREEERLPSTPPFPPADTRPRIRVPPRDGETYQSQATGYPTRVSVYQNQGASSSTSMRDEQMDVDVERVSMRSKTPPRRPPTPPPPSSLGKRVPQSPLPARELSLSRPRAPGRMGRTPSGESTGGREPPPPAPRFSTSGPQRVPARRVPAIPPPRVPISDLSDDELSFNPFSTQQRRDMSSQNLMDMTLGDLRTTRELDMTMDASPSPRGMPTPKPRAREMKAQRVPKSAQGQASTSRGPQSSTNPFNESGNSTFRLTAPSRQLAPSRQAASTQQATSSRSPSRPRIRVPPPPSLRRQQSPEGDQDPDESLAAELRRASSDDDLLETGVLTGFGQRSKRRGFQAHGGAGGTPVFMGVGYVEGAVDSDEAEQEEVEVAVPLHDDEDEDEYQPDEEDEDIEEWEAEEARKKWGVRGARPPTPPKQKARGRARK